MFVQISWSDCVEKSDLRARVIEGLTRSVISASAVALAFTQTFARRASSPSHSDAPARRSHSASGTRAPRRRAPDDGQSSDASAGLSSPDVRHAYSQHAHNASASAARAGQTSARKQRDDFSEEDAVVC